MFYKLTGLFLFLVCFSLNEAQEKYVWASTLNMRDLPGIKGKLIKQLKQGDKVKILGVTDNVHEVVDTVFKQISKFDEKTRRYIEEEEIILKRFVGKWTKIRVGNQEGYVFGFYLSSLNPDPILLHQHEALIKQLEMSPNWKNEEIGCEGCDNNYLRFIDEENEAIIEKGIKQKCGYFSVSFKSFQNSEGDLIGFYLFKDRVNQSCNYSVRSQDGRIHVQYGCCC